MDISGLSITGKILIPAIILLLACIGGYLRVHFFKEKPAKEPEKTVMATVVSKEVKRGTQRSGRSNGGYSYAIHFLTENGEQLELYAYEVEFGGLKEGSHGLLTYKGRYFVCFDETVENPQ